MLLVSIEALALAAVPHIGVFDGVLGDTTSQLHAAPRDFQLLLAHLRGRLDRGPEWLFRSQVALVEPLLQWGHLCGEHLYCGVIVQSRSRRPPGPKGSIRRLIQPDRRSRVQRIDRD